MRLTVAYTTVRAGSEGLSDAQQQHDEARRLLLDDAVMEPVTAGARLPVGLSKDPIVKEVEFYKKQLEKRQVELAEMKQSGADPAVVKKQLALIKKTQDRLELYKKAKRPKDWHSIPGLTKAATAFLESMGGDENYVDWYDRHKNLVEKIYGEDRNWGGGPEAFYLILASLSPANLVQRNLSMGMQAYKNWKNAVAIGDKDFAFTKQTVPGGAMPIHLMNLNRMLGGLPLNGPKVGPFGRNLSGDVDEVTIDMWMGIIFFGRTDPTPKQIDFGKDVVRQIAAKMGKTPRYVQGLLWEMVMKHWGKPDTDFQKAIERTMETYEKTGRYFLSREQRSPKKKPTPGVNPQLDLKLSSRSASLSPEEDDPNAVADAVLFLLEEYEETKGEVPGDPGAGEAPVLSSSFSLVSGF